MIKTKKNNPQNGSSKSKKNSGGASESDGTLSVNSASVSPSPPDRSRKASNLSHYANQINTAKQSAFDSLHGPKGFIEQETYTKYLDSGFFNVNRFTVSEDEKKTTHAKEKGWKVHISLCVSDVQNVRKAYDIIHSKLVDNKVYAWKLLDKSLYSQLEQRKLTGKIVTIYTYREERDYEFIFKEIECALRQANIVPGGIPKVRSGDNYSDQDEQQFSGSQYFYYVNEENTNNPCPFSGYDLSPQMPITLT